MGGSPNRLRHLSGDSIRGTFYLRGRIYPCFHRIQLDKLVSEDQRADIGRDFCSGILRDPILSQFKDENDLIQGDQCHDVDCFRIDDCWCLNLNFSGCQAAFLKSLDLGACCFFIAIDDL